MCRGKTVTVVKEPLKTTVSSPITQNNVFGFGEMQANSVYDYTPVTGVFPAFIIYPRDYQTSLNSEIDIRVGSEPIKIKVQQDCRDFIYNGRTLHLIADNKTFYLDGEARLQLFLNGNYYFFNLKETK
jgi:hypothetical protein